MCTWRVLIGGIGLVVALWATPARAIPDWTFTTLPLDGVISGEAGSTIGWGYSISNLDETNWLVLSTLDSDVFAFGTPDASVFDYPILAPGASVSAPYDGLVGLYQMTWDVDAPVGFLNTGLFTVGADWYDGDPFGGGLFLDTAGQRSTPYVAAVTGLPTAVPEPSTFLLVASGIVAFFVRAPRNRRRLQD